MISSTPKKNLTVKRQDSVASYIVKTSSDMKDDFDFYPIFLVQMLHSKIFKILILIIW